MQRRRTVIAANAARDDAALVEAIRSALALININNVTVAVIPSADGARVLVSPDRIEHSVQVGKLMRTLGFVPSGFQHWRLSDQTLPATPAKGAPTNV
jgi:hypothetical protein